MSIQPKILGLRRNAPYNDKKIKRYVVKIKGIKN